MTVLSFFRKDRTLEGQGIAILLAIADPVARRALRKALKPHFGTRVYEAPNRMALVQGLSSHTLDLVISDAEIQGNTVYDLVEDVRLGRRHSHPFPVIALLSGDPREPALQRARDSGADIVLPATGGVAALIRALRDIRESRPKFVVSECYIGPDQIGAEGMGALPMERLVVPNTLVARNDLAAEDDFHRKMVLATHSLSLIRQKLFSLRLGFTEPAVCGRFSA